MDGNLRPKQQVLTETQPGLGLGPSSPGFPCCFPLTSPLSLGPFGEDPHPRHLPRAGPSPTHVLASFPPYIRWASFSSSMSQYLLQNSVTSLPWSFMAFMGG